MYYSSNLSGMYKVTPIDATDNCNLLRMLKLSAISKKDNSNPWRIFKLTESSATDSNSIIQVTAIFATYNSKLLRIFIQTNRNLCNG